MSNEQQAQEPVAWRYRFLSENGSGLWIFSLKEPGVGDTTRVTVQPLYTAPPLRDLSDDEIKAVFRKSISEQGRQMDFVEIGRALIKESKDTK